MSYGDQVGGAVLGMMLAPFNDQRQLNQQRKLQALGIEGQKQMTDYNYAKQMQMWHDTNYSAQVLEMKKAGINPALLYGQGGAGGATTDVKTASGHEANAPTGGGEVPQMIGMGIQSALLDAQRRNIDADTKLKETEAAKKAGIDTKLGESQVGVNLTQMEKLKQDIKTEAAQEWLTRTQAKIQELDLSVLSATKEDRIAQIEDMAKKVHDELVILDQQAYISRVTRNDMIKAAKADAANKVVLGYLMGTEAYKNLEQSKQIALQNRILNLDLEFYADRFSLDKLKVELEKQKVDFDTDWMRDYRDAILKPLSTLLGAGIIAGAK